MGDALNPNIPLNPPREWFTPPAGMPKDAGCIVEPDGRVYGYLCHWGAVLMDGSTDRWTPPRSRSGYSFAHTGDTMCADGSTVKTANLGGDAGHAHLEAQPGESPSDRAERLNAFYEDTSTQLARVRYGEDDNGVWFAGACWPTVTDLDIARLRASARSGHWATVGDWRDLRTGRAGYELVGACLVNVPGLKYARADRAASGVLMVSPLAATAKTFDADHDGAMVALYLDPALAGELCVDGGEPAEALHITLAYFDDAAADRDDWQDAHEIIAAVSKRHLPLAGKIAGKGVFYADDGGVVHWAHPDVPGLSALREDLAAALNALGFGVREDHGFTPHITLLYDPNDELEAPSVGVHDIGFDRLVLAVGGEMTKLATKKRTRATIERVAAGTVALAPEETVAGVEVAVGGVLMVEGVPTEDGRLIEAGATTWRELPLPLYASTKNLPAHDSADLIGRIDEVWRDESDETRVHWSGVVQTDAAEGVGQEVVNAIDGGRLRGISIDGIVGPDDMYFNPDDVMVMSKITVAGATLTPMPAIGEATVTLLGADTGGTRMTRMQNENATDETDVDADVVVEDEGTEDAASDDKLAAVFDMVTTLAERVEHLIGLVENAQMSARYDAAQRRLAESK